MLKNFKELICMVFIICLHYDTLKITKLRCFQANIDGALKYWDKTWSAFVKKEGNIIYSGGTTAVRL